MAHMKKHIGVLDKPRSIEEVIRDGLRSEELRSNEAFASAIRDMYWEYTRAEDIVTAGNAGDAGKHRYHYSMMRMLLTDLVTTLDGKIMEGKNAKYDEELYGSEEN